MTEFASLSIFAFPIQPEFEAGFTTRQIKSGHCLLYHSGLLTRYILPYQLGRFM